MYHFTAFVLLMLTDYARSFAILPSCQRLHGLQRRTATSKPLRALNDSGDIDDEVLALPLHISNEIEQLENQLSLIEALEQRNEAQIDSFVDKDDQWDSLEEEERELLQSKQGVQERLEVLVSELVNSWMGQKSMEG